MSGHPARVKKAPASQRITEAITMTKMRDQVLKLKMEGKNCLPAQTNVVSKRINAMAQWLTTRFTVNVSFSLRESPLDTVKVMYRRKLLGENNALMATTETAANSSLPSPHNVLEEGWALRSTKTSKPFSEKQRRFLEEKFTIGETTL